MRLLFLTLLAAAAVATLAERVPASPRLLRLLGGQQAAAPGNDASATRPRGRGRRSSRGRGGSSVQARGRGRGRGMRREVPLPREAADPTRLDLNLPARTDTSALSDALQHLTSWEDPLLSAVALAVGNAMFAAALLGPWSLPTVLGASLWWFVLLGVALSLSTKISVTLGGPDLSALTDDFFQEVFGFLPAVGSLTSERNPALVPAEAAAAAVNHVAAILKQAATDVGEAATARDPKRTAVALCVALGMRRLGRRLATLPMAYVVFCLVFALQPARRQIMPVVDTLLLGPVVKPLVEMKQRAEAAVGGASEGMRGVAEGAVEAARAAAIGIIALGEGLIPEAVLGGIRAAVGAHAIDEEDDDNAEAAEAAEAAAEEEEEEEEEEDEDEDEDES